MREVDVVEARAMIAAGEVTPVDVREVDEMVSGIIDGSLIWPLSGLDDGDASRLPSDRSTALLFYCAAGARSLVAAREAEKLGYVHTFSMSGGINEWVRRALPLANVESESVRYSRQTALREVGASGQERLARSTVLVVGAGGTGSAASLYLAAAGVGSLRIVDADRVELSNLTRQILHTTDRVGVAKSSSAEAALHALNPEIRVTGIEQFASDANLAELLTGVDVVVDATDNAPTRDSVNSACVAASIPVVFGSALRFEGTVHAYIPGGPCHRCAHATAGVGVQESCDASGVLGALPGAVGSLQATEVLKILLGVGRPLSGRIVVLDALETRFHTFEIDRNPDCEVCGPSHRH